MLRSADPVQCYVLVWQTTSFLGDEQYSGLLRFVWARLISKTHCTPTTTFFLYRQSCHWTWIIAGRFLSDGNGTCLPSWLKSVTGLMSEKRWWRRRWNAIVIIYKLVNICVSNSQTWSIKCISITPRCILFALALSSHYLSLTSHTEFFAYSFLWLIIFSARIPLYSMCFCDNRFSYSCIQHGFSWHFNADLFYNNII